MENEWRPIDLVNRFGQTTKLGVEDKTPNMQGLSRDESSFCFSSNITQDGEAIDQIDYIMNWEKCAKHEAIMEA